jgi:nucleoside diphosphate kinase/dephospho-CoA kinase
MSVQKVLVILKPDCIQRGLADKIELILTDAGLTIVRREFRYLTNREVLVLYKEHERIDTYPELVSYMLSGQSVILILSGADAVEKVRHLKGRTGSGKGIRGLYAENFIRNIIHSAETTYKTGKEIKMFFPEEDISMNNKKVMFGLSGMTECGKSTAGEYFNSKGVRRLKIIKVLDLVRAEHNPEKELNQFVDDAIKNDPNWLRQAFADKLLEEMDRLHIQYCSLESMGDPEMVYYLRARFPSEFFSIYIDASLEKRIEHQMIRKNLTDVEEAKEILVPKDRFKEDFWHMPDIMDIADVVIDNNGTLSEFTSKLDELLRSHRIL